MTDPVNSRRRDQTMDKSNTIPQQQTRRDRVIADARGSRSHARYAVACVVACACLLAAPHDNTAMAGDTRVVMSSTIQAAPGADVALTIEVMPPESAPAKSFIRIRGLPAAASLSDGHMIAPGAWAVALTDVARLRLFLPARQSGRSDLTVTLVGMEGVVVAETRASLIVAGLPDSGNVAAPATSLVGSAAALTLAPPAPPAAVAPAPVPVARPAIPIPAPLPPPAAVTQPTLSPEELQRAQRFVQKGQQELSEGNVAAARLLFRRAADAGHAQGLFALAGTYDPVELTRLGAFSIQPDLAEARRWYEKALALGANEADARLKRLDRR